MDPTSSCGALGETQGELPPEATDDCMLGLGLLFVCCLFVVCWLYVIVRYKFGWLFIPTQFIQKQLTWSRNYHHAGYNKIKLFPRNSNERLSHQSIPTPHLYHAKVFMPLLFCKYLGRYTCWTGFRIGLMALTVSMEKNLVAIHMLKFTAIGQQERPHTNPNPNPNPNPPYKYAYRYYRASVIEGLRNPDLDDVFQ